jgi:hypothetical protein
MYKKIKITYRQIFFHTFGQSEGSTPRQPVSKSSVMKFKNPIRPTQRQDARNREIIGEVGKIATEFIFWEVFPIFIYAVVCYACGDCNILTRLSEKLNLYSR